MSTTGISHILFINLQSVGQADAGKANNQGAFLLWYDKNLN